jgi:hypothetical protein
MITLEDIEKELDPEQQVGYFAKQSARMKRGLISSQIDKLKTQEKLVGEAIVESLEKSGNVFDKENRAVLVKNYGADVIKSLLTGKRKLDNTEFEAAVKKFGLTGIKGIEAMEHLTKPQKQYLFKQMGYDIGEVE